MREDRRSTVEITRVSTAAQLFQLMIYSRSGAVSYYISQEEAQDLMDDLADCLSQPLMPAPLTHSTIPDG